MNVFIVYCHPSSDSFTYRVKKEYEREAYYDEKKPVASDIIKEQKKANFLVTMGGSLNDPIRIEQVEAMKTVMIGDRIHNRAKTCEMVVFDEMTRGYGNDDNREKREIQFLKKAYEYGKAK